MARRNRRIGPAVRRETDVSRTLARARATARLQMNVAARALGVHPRTIARWEVGEARPRAHQWPRVLAFYAVQAPAPAQALATLVGLPGPSSAATAANHAALAVRVVADAADTLDVAPRRVREVLRAAASAAERARLPFEALLRTMVDEATRDG